VSIALTDADARALEDCVSGGGIAVFPADTVYGLCCDARDAGAMQRLYSLKRRPLAQASAVMFFALERALEALPRLGERERAALRALLPGPVTLLVHNDDESFAPACGEDPSTLGLRVPALSPALAALAAVRTPLLQSSANLSGAPDARTLGDVAPEIREGADLVLDGGELPGVASTVVDLSSYERDGRWTIVRQGARAAAEIGRALEC
jgi:L-threonylcarbamoyladenylate synthase